MRAVSFFGPSAAGLGSLSDGAEGALAGEATIFGGGGSTRGRGGIGVGGAAGFGAAAGPPVGGFGASGGRTGGLIAEPGGGGGGVNVGGRTAVPEGFGTGGRAMGGGAAGFAPGAGMIGLAVGGAGAFVGGRAGKLMRTVSRDSAPLAGALFPGGGNVMRTVSFFGSFTSPMRVRQIAARQNR